MSLLRLDRPTLVAVMGPTASGKTQLAEALAERFGAQLINADAFQVYRGLDIGTAKPPARSDYRLLDLLDPDQEFGVGEWVPLAAREVAQAVDAGRSSVIVGGTGLYLRALFEGWQEMAGKPDPELRAKVAEMSHQAALAELDRLLPGAPIDRANPLRVRRALERVLAPPRQVRFALPDVPKVKVAVVPPRELTDERIRARTLTMIEAGWPEEVARLRRWGVRREDPGMRAIGYRSLWDASSGLCSWESAFEVVIQETRRYAKRQRTWIRSEPGVARVFANVDEALTEA